MPFLSIQDSKILFIHIPKTGGTTIEKWMRTIGKLHLFSPIIPPAFKITPQHFTVSDITLLYGGLVDWEYAFAIVRNPYFKIESEFYFRTQHAFNTFGERPEFSHWFIQQMTLYNRNKFHGDNHFRPQYEFIDESVELFKLEAGLDRVFSKITGKFDLEDIETPARSNVSERGVKTLTWSNEALGLANDVYSQDFELFDYAKKTPSIIMA